VNSVAEVVVGIAVFEALLVRFVIYMFVKLISGNRLAWPLGQQSSLGGGISIRLAVTSPLSGRNVASAVLYIVTVFLFTAFGHCPPGSRRRRRYSRCPA
jgi:hypothetical protein